MNSKENIVEAIKCLSGSVELLHCNAMMLSPLAGHSVYGERIVRVLDGIEVFHNEIIKLANECLNSYEERYSDQLKDIADLSKQLKDEIDESSDS